MLQGKVSKFIVETLCKYINNFYTTKNENNYNPKI